MAKTSTKKKAKKPVKKAVKKSAKKVAKKATKKISKADELKKEIENTIKKNKKSKLTTIVVLTLVRDNFNEKLSTTMGFGFQDLKPEYKEVMVWLTNKYGGSIAYRPLSASLNKIEVSVRA